MPVFYHCDFCSVTFIIIWGFQNKRLSDQKRMSGDALHGSQSQLSFADFLMSVFVGTERVHAVIEMNCFQTGKANNPVIMVS